MSMVKTEQNKIFHPFFLPFFKKLSSFLKLMSVFLFCVKFWFQCQCPCLTPTASYNPRSCTCKLIKRSLCKLTCEELEDKSTQKTRDWLWSLEVNSWHLGAFIAAGRENLPHLVAHKTEVKEQIVSFSNCELICQTISFPLLTSSLSHAVH